MRKQISKFILLMLLPFKLFAAPQFDQIVVFGDSLSDTGRIYDIFSNAHKTIPAIPVLPKSPPYYLGRFSNGPVWIEHLSASLNLKLVNYALGGSLAESFWESGTVFPWSFDTMLDTYLTDNLLDTKKSQHLYVIWGGGNDYLNDPKEVDGVTTKTVNSIERYINKLILWGATHIIVLNLPDLGHTPIATHQGPDTSMHMSLLTQYHNYKLKKMVTEEQRKNAGKAEILFIDAQQYFQDILNNPEKYHIKNINDECYTGGFTFKANPQTLALKNSMNLDLVNNPSLRTAYLNGASLNAEICETPDEYLFWDVIHPTQVAHKIISAQVEKVLRESGWV